MVPAGGIGIRSPIDPPQVTDSTKREKRQKHRICRSEVHGGYTERSGLVAAKSNCRLRCLRADSMPA
jgi:hypothetical protein